MAYRILTNLTFWVLIAIIVGVLIGHFAPEQGVKLSFIGEAFIWIIKKFIPPIIFLTIVLGISGMGDLKKVGRIGLKALIYFEVVTTLALAIGIAVAYWVEPGVGTIDAPIASGATSADQASPKKEFSWLSLLTDNLTLQVLLLAIVVGFALHFVKHRDLVLIKLNWASKYVFLGLKYVMYLAPLGALGGMASVIGKYGFHALVPLAKLMGTVYLTMFLFIFVILSEILLFYRIHIWHLLRYIKEELLIVLGTSSSEAALPSIMQKLENLGCSKSVVGLVVPTGYSFNLDGTSIYLSMSVIFLAQVYGIHLSPMELLSIMGILMLTSKGAAGVSGSGLIVLTSTLALTGIPVEGIALMLGVDKFMSEARAITNLIGNSVATIVISKSEKEFGEPKLD